MVPGLLKRFTCGIFILTFWSLQAQQNPGQEWLHYHNSYRFNEDWTLQSDASFRWKKGFGERAQFLLRTGIENNLSNRLHAAAGIAISRVYHEDNAGYFEFRPHQEIQYTLGSQKWKFNQRFRVEERFFNPVSEGSVQSSNTFNWRLRYAVTGSILLFRLSEKSPDRRFVLSVGDEIMFNAGSGTGRKPFDQNRLLISPSIAFNERLSVSFTWMQRYKNHKVGSRDQTTPIFWLQIRQTLGFKSKKS